MAFGWGMVRNAALIAAGMNYAHGQYTLFGAMLACASVSAFFETKHTRADVAVTR